MIEFARQTKKKHKEELIAEMALTKLHLDPAA